MEANAAPSSSAEAAPPPAPTPRMDAFPPAHPAIDGNRPPGGTRRSGHKTPRKVQWQDYDEPPESSPRALDEHGLDVRYSHC